jgi:hypothetical protein
MIRQPFTPNLFFAASFPTRVNQFNAIRISQPDQGMVGHKALCPLSMGVKQSKKSSPIRQMREKMMVIACQPAIESSVANSFQSKQESQSHNFTGVQ